MREREARFDVLDPKDDAVIEAAFVDCGFEVRERREALVEDTYLDTPNDRLRAARRGLRVRRSAGVATLELKIERKSSSEIVHERDEIAVPWTRDDWPPTLEDLDERIAARTVAFLGVDRLSVRARIATRRATLTVRHILTGAEGRVFHDRVRAESDAGESEFEEIEIEWPESAETLFLETATIVHARLGLGLASKNKLERALCPTGEERPFGRPSELSGKTEFKSFIAVDAASHQAKVDRRFDEFLADPSETAVHDLRVELRRLRSTWRLFRGLVADPIFLSVAALQRRLGDLLGEIRDQDVAIAILGDAIFSSTEDKKRESLRLVRHHERRREKFVARALKYCRSAAFQRAWSKNRSRIEALAERAYEDLRAENSRTRGSVLDIRHVAPGLIARAARRLWKVGEKCAAAPTPEAWHDVRIAARRLRYLADDLRPFFGRPLRGFLKRLVLLQEDLGRLQDLVSTRLALGKLAANDSGTEKSRLKSAAATWSIALWSEIDQVESTLRERWADFAGSDAAEKVRRAVVEL
jgi:CHAD domain-containing protein